MTHLRSVTCHMRSQSVTCYPTQVNTPALTPAIQAGTRFTYPGGMEGWVDLVDLIAPRPGVELAIFWSRVQRSTNAPPRQLAGALQSIRVNRVSFVLWRNETHSRIQNWHDHYVLIWVGWRELMTGWSQDHNIRWARAPGSCVWLTLLTDDVLMSLGFLSWSWQAVCDVKCVFK